MANVSSDISKIRHVLIQVFEEPTNDTISVLALYKHKIFY